EDDPVVNIDRVLDLQVVQLQVADFVTVPDADEVERYAHLRRVARYLDEVFSLGRYAVGQHDEGSERGTTEVVEHLANGGAELAGVVLGIGAQSLHGARDILQLLRSAQ